MLRLYRKPKKGLIGGDISSTSVKMLELSVKHGRYCVESYALVPLPEGAVVEKNIINPEAVAEALEKAIEAANPSTVNAAFAIPTGNVQMKLKITKDTVGSLTSAGYVIDTNALQTNVLVNNGETVVLGGIYEDTHQNDVNKVPFFGDLPWIGNLFKTKTTSDSKNELLIFITPRIVDDTVSRNH